MSVPPEANSAFGRNRTARQMSVTVSADHGILLRKSAREIDEMQNIGLFVGIGSSPRNAKVVKSHPMNGILRPAGGHKTKSTLLVTADNRAEKEVQKLVL